MMTACLPPSRFLVRGSRAPAAGPSLSLTFDDGPHPEHTPRVLDALTRWGQKATFFVVGREAERYPELILEIEGSGHAIGNHSYSHREPQATPAAALLDDVTRADRLLKSVLRTPPRWTRPPKGELTVAKLGALWWAGHSIALWNIDPRDYRMTSSQEADAWAFGYRPSHGDVVLLHDRVPWAAEIVDALGRAGVFSSFRSVVLDDWLPPVRARSNERDGTAAQPFSATRGSGSQRSRPGVPP
jgi:peptidoglycan/xylan/chitin deacetylase (PgdA/CDA1 family)